jgi:hypothetical protein
LKKNDCLPAPRLNSLRSFSFGKIQPGNHGGKRQFFALPNFVPARRSWGSLIKDIRSSVLGKTILNSKKKMEICPKQRLE